MTSTSTVEAFDTLSDLEPSKSKIATWFKGLFHKWMITRQIASCREILSKHRYCLGPNNQKEIEYYLQNLMAQREKL